MSFLINNKKRKSVWKDYGINIKAESSSEARVCRSGRPASGAACGPDDARACDASVMNLPYILKALFLAETHGVGEALLNLCYKGAPKSPTSKTLSCRS